jgi:hypothetical protein
MNRPSGYGFVTKVAGVGGATLVSVKLQEQYGNTTHNKIPISRIIRALQDFAIPVESSKRRRKSVQHFVAVTPSPKRSKVSPKSPKDSLFDLLKEGARTNKKAGWYLNMIHKKKDANGRGNENGSKHIALQVK